MRLSEVIVNDCKQDGSGRCQVPIREENGVFGEFGSKNFNRGMQDGPGLRVKRLGENPREVGGDGGRRKNSSLRVAMTRD